MISYREMVTSLRDLGIERSSPVIIHASLAAFGEVSGGVDTLLGALLTVYSVLLMPAFTYRTMVVPEVGPPDNGITYGSGRASSNLQAEFFRPDIPVDRSMGELAESLRRLPSARRSQHPILSFSGLNAEAILSVQSLAEPLAPIRSLLAADGWVLLMGVDHTRNISLHYAERLAGRKHFIRWALTPQGVVECPNMPGCSRGFAALAPQLTSITRQVHIGPAIVQAVPLAGLIETARAWVAADPLALLCSRLDCEPCQAVRSSTVGI